VSYRALPDEAGPEKTFDLSSRTAADQWQVGRLDMREALGRLKTYPPNAHFTSSVGLRVGH
jgi:hypothetical protein